MKCPKIFHKLLLIMIIFHFSEFNRFNTNAFFFVFCNEEIKLKIKGAGIQNVVSDLFNEIPDEVYKGQALIGSNSKQVNLSNALIIDNGEDIEIKIIFNNKLRNCLYMFYQLKNITFIDLSLFDISEVSTMSNMFYGCHSLTSIVFGKIGASKVEDLGGIFNECGSLREIDLSKFDTSLVTNMGGMFADCY